MKLFIGSDHAGYQYKEQIKAHFMGYDWNDMGCDSEDSVDYPDYAHAVANNVADNNTKGVLICGSANGVAMTANKNKNIRAAIAWTEEIAELARLHNDANIVCIPARFIDVQTAIHIIDIFLNTRFEGGRHQKRVEKI